MNKIQVTVNCPRLQKVILQGPIEASILSLPEATPDLFQQPENSAYSPPQYLANDIVKSSANLVAALQQRLVFCQNCLSCQKKFALG